MPRPEDQLKDVAHRLSQIKPAALDEFMKNVSERAKTDGGVAQCLDLMRQLKDKTRSLELKSPAPETAAGGVASALPASDYIVIILLLLLF